MKRKLPRKFCYNIANYLLYNDNSFTKLLGLKGFLIVESIYMS